MIEKLSALAEKKPMEGQDKFYNRIRNEGILWNHKRVERVYRLMGLNKRRRTKKRVPARIKEPLVVPLAPNQTWSMDFMHDTLMNGRKFRVLNIIDDYNRESLKIEPYFSISAERVVSIVERVILERGQPKSIRVDNGPEFISKVMQEWCIAQSIKLQFIQPGKPMQNGYIESFNGKFRDECLNLHWFLDLDDARKIIDAWRLDYNTVRPHSSLINLSPVAYLKSFQSLPESLIPTG